MKLREDIDAAGWFRFPFKTAVENVYQRDSRLRLQLAYVRR
jgi:hypothetical protein